MIIILSPEGNIGRIRAWKPSPDNNIYVRWDNGTEGWISREHMKNYHVTITMAISGHMLTDSMLANELESRL